MRPPGEIAREPIARFGALHRGELPSLEVREDPGNGDWDSEGN